MNRFSTTNPPSFQKLISPVSDRTTKHPAPLACFIFFTAHFRAEPLRGLGFIFFSGYLFGGGGWVWNGFRNDKGGWIASALGRVKINRSDDYLRLMIQLRWIALWAVAACLYLAFRLTEGVLYWPLLGAAVGLGFLSNLVAVLVEPQICPPVRGYFSKGLLIFDSLLLAVLLGGSGGAHNPLSSLYLLHVVLAAILFDRWTALFVAVIASVSFGYLYVGFPHLAHHHGGISHDLHLQGMVVVLAVMSLVIVFFVDRLKREAERTRQKLETKERLEALATLAAGVAHELSTPLGTIAIAAKELEKIACESCLKGACKQDARLIREEVDRCRAIIDQLDQNNLNSLKSPNEVFDLRGVGDDLAGVLSVSAYARLRFHFEGPSLCVRAPRSLLMQAVASLVQNALLADSSGMPIDVSVRRQGDNVCLQIRDQGTGMDAATLGQLGTPFFTTRKRGDGIGMGVFIARSLVERLGGTLSFESSPGRGTKVELLLPRVCDQAVLTHDES